MNEHALAWAAWTLPPGVKAAILHRQRVEKAVLRVMRVRPDLSEAVILEQANKLAQSVCTGSVFDVLEGFAQCGAMGVPLPFEATKEGANSMNEGVQLMRKRRPWFWFLKTPGRSPEPGRWSISRVPRDYPAMSVQQSQEAREIAQRLADVFHIDAQELMNQARKMVQGSGFTVLYPLKVWEKTANECPHWVGATKEGANSMNESKSAKQLFAESKANFSVINMVRDGAVLAGNRLELGDRPELVFAELRAAVDRAFSLVEKPTTEDQSTVHMTLDPALQLVSNEELRKAICDTVQQLKSGPFGQVAPKEVQERLLIHLDGLLKTEAMLAGMLVAGADVTAKPVEG